MQKERLKLFTGLRLQSRYQQQASSSSFISMKNIGTLCHWGPLIALSLISIISSVTVYCSLIWWPIDTQGGIINLTIFLSWVTSTFYNYFRAIHLGPGYVPQDWKPVSNMSDNLEQEVYIRLYTMYVMKWRWYKYVRLLYGVNIGIYTP